MSNGLLSLKWFKHLFSTSIRPRKVAYCSSGGLNKMQFHLVIVINTIKGIHRGQHFNFACSSLNNSRRIRSPQSLKEIHHFLHVTFFIFFSTAQRRPRLFSAVPVRSDWQLPRDHPASSVFIWSVHQDCHFPFKELFFLLPVGLTPLSCFCSGRSGSGLRHSPCHLFLLRG